VRNDGTFARFDRRAHAFLALQGVLLFGASTTRGVLGRAIRDVRDSSRWLFSTIVFMNPVGCAVAVRHAVDMADVRRRGACIAGVALLFVPELTLASMAATLRSESCWVLAPR